MAAHAATLLGVESMVFSTKRKSPLYGAQYLHKPIPFMTPRGSVEVEYRLVGTAEQYRSKVYGPMWDGTVSPEDLAESHQAWDIRATYDRLWEVYSEHINDLSLDPGTVHRMMDMMGDEVDLWVNTIPMPALCSQGHAFGSIKVWAAGDAPDLGIDIGSTFRAQPNSVVCNGNGAPAWYRLSNIYGHTTVEWPGDIRPPVRTASEVTKPTSTTCTCFPRMMRVGRYGSWEKGVLSHTAFDKVYGRLEDMISGKAAKEGQGVDTPLPGVW